MAITTAMRSAILARLDAGHTYLRVATELGITRSAVAGVAYRAKRRGRVFAQHPATAAWSSESVAELRRLCALGLSDASIAACVGRSEKAVSKKRHKLRLRKDVFPRLRQPPRQAPVPAAPLRNVAVTPEPPLTDIWAAFSAPAGCRYVHGDPKGALAFCGAATDDGASYCAGHHAIVYRSGHGLDDRPAQRPPKLSGLAMKRVFA